MQRKRRRRSSRLGLSLLTSLAWISVFAIGYVTLAPTSTSTAITANLELCQWSGQHNCVVDGDTIRYGGSTIRLEDIDAPETGEPQCAFERGLGQRATRRLLELVNTAAFEVVYTGGRDTDRYGRKLRRLERNGRSLGDTLIAEGLARRWDGARRSWC